MRQPDEQSEVSDAEFEAFVADQRAKFPYRKIEVPRSMQRLGRTELNISAPPFDDPRYIDRCNRAWREEYRHTMQELRERWKKIIFNCIAGQYGHAVRDDWQSGYPGFNPETACDEVLMQAAQAVWAAKGVKCIERICLCGLLEEHDSEMPANNAAAIRLRNGKLRTQNWPGSAMRRQVGE